MGDLLFNDDVDRLVIVVSLFGVYRIIVKAGYSKKFFLVPLVTLVLWIITYAWEKIAPNATTLLSLNTHSGTESFFLPKDAGLWEGLYLALWLSLVVNWLLFFGLVIGRWPLSGTALELYRLERKQGAAAFVPIKERSVIVATDPRGLGAPQTDAERLDISYAPPSMSSAVPPAPVLAGVTVEHKEFCVKCGASVGVTGLFFHECPSAGEPPTHCAHCGNKRASTDTPCAYCGAT